jgi:hypothetical protein
MKVIYDINAVLMIIGNCSDWIAYMCVITCVTCVWRGDKTSNHVNSIVFRSDLHVNDLTVTKGLREIDTFIILNKIKGYFGLTSPKKFENDVSAGLIVN